MWSAAPNRDRGMEGARGLHRRLVNAQTACVAQFRSAHRRSRPVHAASNEHFPVP